MTNLSPLDIAKAIREAIEKFEREMKDFDYYLSLYITDEDDCVKPSIRKRLNRKKSNNEVCC